MRRDQQAVDLLIAAVDQREHRPIGEPAGLTGAHFDAAHDAIGTGRGGDLDAIVRLAEELNRLRQVERLAVERHGCRLERVGGRARDSEYQQ